MESLPTFFDRNFSRNSFKDLQTMQRQMNRIFDQVYDAYEYCLRSKRAVPLRPPVFA